MVLCLASPVVTSAAEDPFNGKWKVDESRSKLPANAPRTQALRLEVDEKQLQIDYQGVDGNGRPAEWKIRADFGGNLSGVLGTPEMDAVRCWRSDERTILVKMSRGAETIGWETLEVAKNGKTLKLTHAVTDAKGKETKSVSTFEKQ